MAAGGAQPTTGTSGVQAHFFPTTREVTEEATQVVKSRRLIIESYELELSCPVLEHDDFISRLKAQFGEDCIKLEETPTPGIIHVPLIFDPAREGTIEARMMRCCDIIEEHVIMKRDAFYRDALKAQLKDDQQYWSPELKALNAKYSEPQATNDDLSTTEESLLSSSSSSPLASSVSVAFTPSFNNASKRERGEISPDAVEPPKEASTLQDDIPTSSSLTETSTDVAPSTSELPREGWLSSITKRFRR